MPRTPERRLRIVSSTKADNTGSSNRSTVRKSTNSSKEQVCKLSEVSAQPSDIRIAGYRGIGTLTNIKGEKARFNGRKLDSQEMTVVPGEIGGKPWVITVKAEDGSSTHTYKLKIIH